MTTYFLLQLKIEEKVFHLLDTIHVGIWSLDHCGLSLLFYSTLMSLIFIFVHRTLFPFIIYFHFIIFEGGSVVLIFFSATLSFWSHYLDLVCLCVSSLLSSFFLTHFVGLSAVFLPFPSQERTLASSDVLDELVQGCTKEVAIRKRHVSKNFFLKGLMHRPALGKPLIKVFFLPPLQSNDIMC